MKKILLACLVFSIWYLVFGTPAVLAKCLNASGAPGCSGGCSCLYDFFSVKSQQNCDPNSTDSDQCFCSPANPSQYGCGITTPPVPTSPPTTSTLPPSFQIACNSGNSGDKDSRPVACESCSQTTLLTPACASNFSLIDSVNYQKSDAGIMCNNQHWLEKEWGGTITIDPNNTKVPFVGKKGQESEQKYLADYFEGTKYYKPELDLSTCNVCQTDPTSASCQTCQQKLQDIILTAGVWSKLAPTQLQDDLKRQMVSRAAKGEIHDYKIEYGNQSAVLTEFTAHLKPQQKDFTSPDAYQNNLNSWKASDNGKWSTLWTAIPMFSREDTPGEITPELGKRPADTVSRQSQAEQVPHLARLYEVTGALQKILVPFSSPSPTPQPTPVSQINNNSKTAVAFTPAELNSIYQSQGKVLAGNTSFYGCKFYYGNNSDPRDCSCMGRIKPDGSNECRSEDPNQQCCPPHGFFGICGWGDCKLDGPDAHCQSKNIPQNGCPFIDIIDYPPEPPQPPAILCGLGGPKSIPNCSPKEALTDPNPNDTICCQNMKISLAAVDTFANTQYEGCPTCYKECLSGCDDKLARDVIKENSNCWSNCDATVSEPVSRGMAVNLQHPYLKEIWQQTAEITSGLFNIFRPQTTEKFPDTPAKSTIDYSFDDPKNPAAHAEPPTGDFYFPYLGGIQEAKEFVINLLNPSGGSSSQGNSGGGVNPTPIPTPTPATITIDYVIQYRDPTAVTMTSALKQRIIDNVKANENWKNTTQIEQYFDFVVSEAVKPENGGWNPAFVLALWIEESGANAINNAWGLGCGVTTGVAKDIQSQLPCLFNVSYKDADFKNFMCKYSDGLNATYPCSFKNNPNFVAGIKTWYNCTTGISCPYK